MLPRARPLKSSCANMWTWGIRGRSPKPPYRGLLHRHGDDLPLLPRDEDVVLLVQRVVLVGRERAFVGLDQAAVVAEVLERVANLRAVGRAGLVDGERD